MKGTKPSSELHLILAKRGERSVQFWKAEERSNADIHFGFEKEIKFDDGIESLSIFSEHGNSLNRFSLFKRN